MAYTTINDASANFQYKKYTGNGSDGHQITFDGNSNLQPDLAIAKDLGGGNWWVWYDSTRGGTKMISSNSNNGEATDNNITAFNTDGVTLGTANDSNGNGGTYNLYGWKANGGSRTTFTESSNNPGGGYQANTTAGFSIVDYTGTGGAGTVQHGLGAVPHFILVKRRNASDSWRVYHKDLGLNGSYPNFLQLDQTAAKASGDSGNFTAAPSSTVFSVGNYGVVNGNNDTYIAYAFTEKKGYSAFAGYEGNGNADGPFVYTGFRPKVVIVKNSSNTGIWRIYDNSDQNGFNPIDRYKSLESNGAEGGTSHPFDFLANGFKVRGTNSDVNSDGDRFAFAAYADRPFVSSAGVPSPAR